ncbi:MAG: fluoride efflux transporter CrcB [Acidobacteria bacterium]|nr:fluoride efflux transporter CrcB [Acidobacteriota bacterium]
MNSLWIALGAGLGGVLRYWCGGAAARLGAETFPWGTMFINVAGSAFIGFFATLTGDEGRLLVSPSVRLFVMTGICGGFTTFSTFSLETLRLMQDREWGYAALNAAGSLGLCLLGVWLGHQLAGMLNQR